MVDGFAKTPRYVLKDGPFPTCPNVSWESSDENGTVIFGFVGKPEYDVFLSASSLTLTPYPLVKRFLQSQIELDNGSLKLVVLGATSAGQDCLYAATFQAVLEAFEIGAETVPISHQLIREDESTHYRIEAYSLVN